MRTLDGQQYYQRFFEEFGFSTGTPTRLLAIDIVNVMSEIYYADISDKKTTPRSIPIDIPVYYVNKWVDCKDLLQRLLKWVSEDNFEITFIENTSPEQTKDVFLQSYPSIDTITLFSGGLDSFAGAYVNYKNGIQSDYLGFVNKGEERTKQVVIRKFYNDKFPDSSVHLLEKHPIEKKFFIQSTRSLLYLSLAVAKGLTADSYKRIQIYENGVLSLNPELYGRYTTKTTHPYTLYLFNELLQQLDIHFQVENPFLFKTKGQLFDDLSEEFKRQIGDTFTCGQSRLHSKRNHHGQCGVCIPCLLRKISLAANDLELYDATYEYTYGIKLREIQEDEYRKDYESNIEYFSEYVRLIKNGEIFSYLQTRSMYYKDPFALEKTKDMLDIFVQEFERFVSRYAPY